MYRASAPWDGSLGEAGYLKNYAVLKILFIDNN